MRPALDRRFSLLEGIAELDETLDETLVETLDETLVDDYELLRTGMASALRRPDGTIEVIQPTACSYRHRAYVALRETQSDGVGVVRAYACYVREDGSVRRFAHVDVSYDSWHPSPYRSKIIWGDGPSYYPHSADAMGETPDEIMARSTRGLYACDWGADLLQAAVACCALLARGHVDPAPAWMMGRARKELDRLAHEFIPTLP